MDRSREVALEPRQFWTRTSRPHEAEALGVSNVYYCPVNRETTSETIRRLTRLLLEKVVDGESLPLDQIIPLKVHFGEKGNITYIKPDNYLGIIDFLRERGIESCYMETSVLYGGQRSRSDLHVKTALEHGFVQLPIVIADGEQGESFIEVEIDQKHFRSCKIGRAFLDTHQLIVLSHFKGHFLAGFGGAIKQLSMGHASKGGKLAMHMGIKPRIRNRKCKKCGLCLSRCRENAITIGPRSYIDHEKCVGCGACVSTCPTKAISIYSVRGILNAATQGKRFMEKLAEYALAAQKGKKNIYVNFAMDITRGCDCEPRKMKPMMDDMGIFASTDPVAIDKACLDMAREKGTRFRGVEQLLYAEKIGVGSTRYRLQELSAKSRQAAK